MKTSTDASGMKYDVFLSFNGSDTRNNFTSCLYHDMVEKGIHVFKDDEELIVGEKIEELFKALDDSQIYIPIFSRNFASSSWCLREVAGIVDCTSKSGGKKEILPLFFDVKPEDVKLETELYSNALSKLEEEKKYEPGEVKRWRDALREVPTRVGWKLEGKEHGELMKTIVREVLLKLKSKNRSLPDKLVEMDDEKGIGRLLGVDSADHARFIIIHGAGGIGKTTLASVLFNRFSSNFRYSSFLEDVGSSSEPHALLDVQKKLLSDTLGTTSPDEIQDTNDGIARIRGGLCKKKVLIVIDNVNEKKQLDHLAGSCRWFGPGSKIIVTVRDRRTIIERTIQDEANQTGPSYYVEYPVKEMPLDRAIRLFSKHAFISDSPPKEWHSFSEEVVSSIGRLPLTLKVVGSLFACTNRSEWDKKLKGLQKSPPRDVRDSLMMSIDKLVSIEKGIFLDIACFCIGEDKMKAYYMWADCEYFPYDAIDDLLLMSLININEDNTFRMHDEVRDVGRYIVKEKKLDDVGNRRWVQIDETTRHLLRSSKEKPGVLALSLGISHDLKPEEIALWPELRFLGGERLNFVGDFKDCLPNLRWLSWRHCPPEFSPTNLHLIYLVVLDLSNSKITDDWGGWMQIKMAKNLKMLDLTHCVKLTTTPDFSEFGKLEILILKGCRNLHMIDKSIGELKLLNTLDIRDCMSLEELPEAIGSLEHLSKIIMAFSDRESKSPALLNMLVSVVWRPGIPIGIKKLPHSIGGLKQLVHLNMSFCGNLHDLPDSIGELMLLVKLDLRFSGITVLPYSIGRLASLKFLLLRGCKNIHKLPDSMGGLKSLVKLDLDYSGISELPNSIGGLKNLKFLFLRGCKILHELSDSIRELELLEYHGPSR